MCFVKIPCPSLPLCAEFQCEHGLLAWDWTKTLLPVFPPSLNKVECWPGQPPVCKATDFCGITPRTCLTLHIPHFHQVPWNLGKFSSSRWENTIPVFGTGTNECSEWEVCNQLELVGGMYRGEEKCHVWLKNKGPISTGSKKVSLVSCHHAVCPLVSELQVSGTSPNFTAPWHWNEEHRIILTPKCDTVFHICLLTDKACWIFTLASS